MRLQRFRAPSIDAVIYDFLKVNPTDSSKTVKKLSSNLAFLAATGIVTISFHEAMATNRTDQISAQASHARVNAHALYTSQLASVLRVGEFASSGAPVEINAAIRNLPVSLAQQAFEKARYRDVFIGRGHYLYIASAPIDADGVGSSIVCLTDTHKINYIFRAITIPESTPFDPMKTRSMPDGFKTRFESSIVDLHTGQSVDLSGWNSAWGHCGNLMRQLGARHKLPELIPLYRGR